MAIDMKIMGETCYFAVIQFNSRQAWSSGVWKNNITFLKGEILPVYISVSESAMGAGWVLFRPANVSLISDTATYQWLTMPREDITILNSDFNQLAKILYV